MTSRPRRGSSVGHGTASRPTDRRRSRGVAATRFVAAASPRPMCWFPRGRRDFVGDLVGLFVFVGAREGVFVGLFVDGIETGCLVGVLVGPRVGDFVETGDFVGLFVDATGCLVGSYVGEYTGARVGALVGSGRGRGRGRGDGPLPPPLRQSSVPGPSRLNLSSSHVDLWATVHRTADDLRGSRGVAAIRPRTIRAVPAAAPRNVPRTIHAAPAAAPQPAHGPSPCTRGGDATRLRIHPRGIRGGAATGTVRFQRRRVQLVVRAETGAGLGVERVELEAFLAREAVVPAMFCGRSTAGPRRRPPSPRRGRDGAPPRHVTSRPRGLASPSLADDPRRRRGAAATPIDVRAARHAWSATSVLSSSTLLGSQVTHFPGGSPSALLRMTCGQPAAPESGQYCVCERGFPTLSSRTIQLFAAAIRPDGISRSSPRRRRDSSPRNTRSSSPRRRRDISAEYPALRRGVAATRLDGRPAALRRGVAATSGTRLWRAARDVFYRGDAAARDPVRVAKRQHSEVSARFHVVCVQGCGAISTRNRTPPSKQSSLPCATVARLRRRSWTAFILLISGIPV